MVTKDNGGGTLIREICGTIAPTKLECSLLLTVEYIYRGIQVLLNIVSHYSKAIFRVEQPVVQSLAQLGDAQVLSVQDPRDSTPL